MPLLGGPYLRALLAITYYLWYKQKKCNTCNLLSVDYPAAWLISTRLNESRLGFAGLNTRHGSVRASWIGDVADGGVDGEDGEGSHGSLSAARHSANERNHSRRSAPIARLPSRHLSCTQLGRLLQRLALQRHHPWHFHWLFKFNYLPPPAETAVDVLFYWLGDVYACLFRCCVSKLDRSTLFWKEFIGVVFRVN